MTGPHGRAEKEKNKQWMNEKKGEKKNHTLVSCALG